MNPRTILIPSLLFCLALSSATAAEPDAATATDDGGDIVLQNSLLALTLSKKSGDLTSIRLKRDGKEVELSNRKDGMYFDADGAGHFRPTHRRRLPRRPPRGRSGPKSL